MASASTIGSYKIAFSPDLSAFTSVGATISRTLSVGVTAGLEGASSGLQGLSGALGSVSNILDGISSKIFTGLAAGIGAATAAAARFVPQAVHMSDAEAGFRSTLKFAGLTQEQIRQLETESRKYADSTVYDLDDIQGVVAQLSANGVKGSERIAEAAGNLNAVAGGSKDTYRSLALVITQTQGLGHLNTENWNQLSNAIPGASGRLKDALKSMGAYTGNFADALAGSKISAEEFEQAIVSLGDTQDAYERATATDTFSGAFGNLEATVVGGLMDQIDQNKGVLTDFINNLNGPAARATQIFGQGLSAVTAVMSGQKTAMQVLGDAYQSALAKIESAIQTLKQDSQGMGTELMQTFNRLIDGSLTIGDAFNALKKTLQGHLSSGDIGVIVLGVTAAIPILAKATSLASVLTGALSWVIGVAGRMSGVLFSVLGAATKGLGSLFNGSALSGVSRLVTSLTTGLSPVILIVGAIVAAFAAFFTQTQQGQQLWGELMTALQQFWIAIQPALQQLLIAGEQLFEVLQPALAQIFAALQPIMAVITQLVIALLPTLAPIISTIVTFISTAVQVIASVLSSLMPVIEFGVSLASEVLSAIGQVIIAIVQGLGPVISGFAGLVTTVVTNIGSFISNLVGFITALFNGDLSGAISHLGGMFKSLVGIVGAIIGPIRDIGVNIVRGIWSGISSGWGWLTRQLSRFVENFLAFMRHLFGIGSPSKLMADGVGVWLPRGIGVGIGNAEGELLSQADAFSSELSNRLSATASVTAETSGLVVPQQIISGYDYRIPSAQQQPNVTINQEVAKADSAMDVYLQTKRAAAGYFGRGIVAYPSL